MPGLFGTFNISKSGLFAQQKAIDVTSHNISNANTDGYSRQRAEMQTTTPYCMPSMNGTGGVGQMGTGVEVSAIERIRDSFLDYQVRVQKGINGCYSSRDNFLSNVENILNEPTDTGISSLIGKFFDAWQKLSSQSQTSDARTVVAQQAEALANELNNTYNELQKLKGDAQTQIKDTIFGINGTLKDTSNVNQQIAEIKVSGNNPNDLMDTRDNYLDELSEKFGITIDKKSLDAYDIHAEEINESSPSAPIIDAGPPKKAINLVQIMNPDETARFSYIQSIEPSEGQKAGTAGKYTVTYYKNGDTTNDANKVTINNVELDSSEYKRMDECRILWADKDGNALKVNSSTGEIESGAPATFGEMKLFEPDTGELKGDMMVQQDIDNYIDELNKFAKGIALSVNAVHSQSASFTSDDTSSNPKVINNFFVNSSQKDASSYAEADEDAITAQNISVNAEISKEPMTIQAGIDSTSGDGDGKRALAIAQLRDKLMNISGITSSTSRKDLLTKASAGDLLQKDSTLGGVETIVNNAQGSTIDNYFKDTIDKLGIQEQDAKRIVKNEKVVLAGYQESRDSTSGVSLDEEIANLVQYQHAYTANAKVISTVDQLLDVVINDLKR